ncbi:hypothetical protein Tco_1467005 [Tanacetum coccineum]
MYCTPLYLHPHLPDPNLSMDRLPSDVIGDWFSFDKRRNTKDISMDDGPSSMKLWKNKFFFIDRRVVPDYLTWRNFVRLRKQCSFDLGLALLGSIRSVTRFLEGKMIILRLNYIIALAAEGAHIPMLTPKEIVASQPNPTLAKKSKAHVKQKVSTYLVGPSKVARPKRRRRLKSKVSKVRSSSPVAVQADDVEDVDHLETDYYAFLEGNVERDGGNSSRAAYALVLRSGKRLHSPPPCLFNPILYDSFPTSGANAHFSHHANVHQGRAEVIRRQLDPMDMLAQSTLARNYEYDQIPDDDFSTTTLGEEIDLTLFPLIFGPYCMSYPFSDREGSDPPKYNNEEWNGPHAPEANILSKDIFKDPDV